MQDKAQAENKSYAYSERSRGVPPVPIGGSQSVCFFHLRLQSNHKLSVAFFFGPGASGHRGAVRLLVTQLSSQTAMRRPLDV